LTSAGSTFDRRTHAGPRDACPRLTGAQSEPDDLRDALPSHVQQAQEDRVAVVGLEGQQTQHLRLSPCNQRLTSWAPVSVDKARSKVAVGLDQATESLTTAGPSRSNRMGVSPRRSSRTLG